VGALLRAAASRRTQAGLLAGLALLAFVAVLLARGGGGDRRAAQRELAAARADAGPYDGRSPRAPTGDEQRVLVALPRPPLGGRADAAALTPARQRAYVASLRREGAALRSALDARGVQLSDVVTFERTWNGFAATVATGDLADLGSLGVRAEPVRRFYPATSEPVPAPAAPRADAVPPGRRAPVAVLAAGVETEHPLLRGRLVPGYDAVDGDADPRPGADPGGRRRGETSGTSLAGVLALAGERVMPIRVAALQALPDLPAPEELGASDGLLAGLERAVDPDGDGATDDRVPVALVGVNAPYAGFGDSPEAEAVAGAARLGTLVVAPAGGEGAAAPGSATVGSPAAAAEAVAVGALAAPAAVARVELEAGAIRIRAALLGGRPPRGEILTAGPLAGADPGELLRPGAPRLQGRLAIVRAGPNAATGASAAAAAGARAVLLAEPRERPLPLMPAGRIAVPVLGVTGRAAVALLRTRPGTGARLGDPAPGLPPARGGRLSPFSARGPTAGGTLKPDLAAAGAAVTASPGGRVGMVGGTAVAAARVAAAAAR
jgi:hypothetical protein